MADWQAPATSPYWPESGAPRQRQRTSTPTGQNYSDGAPLYTGRVGAATQPEARAARQAQNYGFGGGAPSGPNPADAQAAFGQHLRTQNEVINALKSGQGYGSQQYTGGQFGQSVERAALNPQGFSPEAMQAMQRQIERGYAGSQANQLTAMRNRAGATGFGESAALMDAEARARAGNTSDMQTALAQLGMQNEQARFGREDSAREAYMQLMGLGQNQFLGGARLHSGATFPFFPGAANVYGGAQGGGMPAPQGYQQQNPYNSQQNPYWGNTGYRSEYERRLATNNSPYAFQF